MIGETSLSLMWELSQFDELHYLTDNTNIDRLGSWVTPLQQGIIYDSSFFIVLLKSKSIVILS